MSFKYFDINMDKICDCSGNNLGHSYNYDHQLLIFCHKCLKSEIIELKKAGAYIKVNNVNRNYDMTSLEEAQIALTKILSQQQILSGKDPNRIQYYREKLEKYLEECLTGESVSPKLAIEKLVH